MRSEHVPPAVKISVQLAIWTIASGAAGRLGAHLPSSTMCSAYSTAQARTRTSPTPIPVGPPVRKRRPPSETTVATHVHHRMGAPHTLFSRGAKTTNMPGMRPALPGLVFASPAVCLTYPPPHPPPTPPPTHNTR